MITENDLVLMSSFGALIATLLLQMSVYMMVARRMQHSETASGEALKTWTRSAWRFCVTSLACFVSIFALGLTIVGTYGNVPTMAWAAVTAVSVAMAV